MQETSYKKDVYDVYVENVFNTIMEGLEKMNPSMKIVKPTALLVNPQMKGGIDTVVLGPNNPGRAKDFLGLPIIDHPGVEGIIPIWSGEKITVSKSW